MKVNNSDNIKDEKKNTYFIYLLLFAILLFFCVFGITYSIYKPGIDDNELDTGKIIFTYSDVGKAGNGISLKNAEPLSDNRAKIMVGNNQYFDFNTTATTKNASIHYKLLIDKDNKSTLSNNNVRIYLTQILGGYESELVFSNFSDLKVEKINNKNYYVIYEKTLSKGLDNYTDSFRLRMWLKEDATNYYDQYFAVKVDVYAYQVEE